MIGAIFQRLFKTNLPIPPNTSIGNDVLSKSTYNFLVVAARQDELSAFTAQSSNIKKGAKVELGAIELTITDEKESITVLSYTPNTMGMAFNAAAIMRVINRYNPIYTFFIGTCAGLDSNKNIIGDVLIPQNIYNYESGKHKDDGTFESDHHCYSTDDDMRKYGEIVKNRVSNKFRIITDEHFCSGSAVVDYKSKKDEIKNGLPRKVNGLDMEAYSIACINYILREEGKKLSVVKAIMDFGENKETGDKNMDKEIAMKNSAKATLEIIKYIHTEIING